MEELAELEREAAGLAALVVERAAAAGATIATAESCTAGLVAATIASVPGASAVLLGGAVTYCDRVKHEVLGVSAETLRRHTAVSEPTALEMAAGARRLFGAAVGVSLTGYAGPGGGTAADPAGTVYLATCTADGARCERCRFTGERNAVRAKAAIRALELVLARL